MATIITAPEKFEKYMMEDPFTIFLAGSFADKNWREDVMTKIVDLHGLLPVSYDLLFLNPYRSDWEDSNVSNREQIEWELMAMEQCNHIIIHLQRGVDSPVSLLWTGMHMFDTKISLSIERGFAAREEVMLACKRYNVPVFNALQDNINYTVMRFLEKDIGRDLLRHTS